ncbi:MAG: hypothetical protein QGF28_02365 [Candidatus Thalassarchaeaceae archaeon]|jgi:hypothetical protein|nr:hypothetical protein [Euryarchaeota archaeon]MDP7092060.1 hypothetical protein [Candidatus Thalassarchaeaceae archaeon]MBV43476.1 hypothetical protein [Euryarchaeota archaeon]MDP7256792.1 hypothetical protein [Candidatus Thalassarchaeaceae archaeon]MDP7446032.1 hypothetical protein [Candidatus Thalassarchaeaceae archaeon]|tara:strand:+ start:6770 stop:7297 length:528 start_codon:yes stop_codon:yes gene_type:complete
MTDERISIEVATQTFRFIPEIPVSLEDAVQFGGGRSNGAYAVIEHENPRSTLVIEPRGSILVHGISNIEAATLIAREFLLRIGMSESGLTVEKGDMLVSFSLGRSVLLELAAERFPAAEHDLRLDALRIDAKRHGCTILLFNNGHGLILGQTSRNIAELAVGYWTSHLEAEGALA